MSSREVAGADGSGGGNQPLVRRASGTAAVAEPESLGWPRPQAALHPNGQEGPGDRQFVESTSDRAGPVDRRPPTGDSARSRRYRTAKVPPGIIRQQAAAMACNPPCLT